MNDWTPQKRLHMISILSAWASTALKRVKIREAANHTERIYYLSTADDQFLEKNRANYADVIERLNAESA